MLRVRYVVDENARAPPTPTSHLEATRAPELVTGVVSPPRALASVCCQHGHQLAEESPGKGEARHRVERGDELEKWL